MRNRLAIFISVILLAACGEKVPTVQDPHNIVIDGKKMTQAEFLKNYCLGKDRNETCLTVLQAKKEDSTRREMPKNW